MKRELKFRFWDPGLKKFIDVEKDFNYDYAVMYDGTPCKVYNDSCQVALKTLDNVVVSQYTGLKDKNGKEIYEGDICQWEDCGELFKGKMFFDNYASAFRVQLPAGHITSYKLRPEHLEVIGNIYENPKLLG